MCAFRVLWDSPINRYIYVYTIMEITNPECLNLSTLITREADTYWSQYCRSDT